jgi:chemosensory pili system protein ChpA (sensor histidine kinase/response regulator)
MHWPMVHQHGFTPVYSYQELHQLRGLESAFEVDLFFPEFGVELPAEVLDVPQVAAASIKTARAQYQRALLKWLRQDNPAESLRTMRSAVQTVMACAPQDQHRATVDRRGMTV